MESTRGKLAVAERSGCGHVWRRVYDVEDTLRVAVFIRRCYLCHRMEAKAGQRDPDDNDFWVLIEAEDGIGVPLQLQAD